VVDSLPRVSCLYRKEVGRVAFALQRGCAALIRVVCSTGRRASLLREVLTAGMEAVCDTPKVFALVHPLLADIVWRHVWSMAVVVSTLDVGFRARSSASTEYVIQMLPQCVVCSYVKH
jgi:hypothetical protein